MKTAICVLYRGICVINCGSSSIKFQVIQVETKSVLVKGSVDRLNTGNSRLRVFSPIKGEKIEEELLNVSNHTEGVEIISQILRNFDFQAIGHRVVHGGDYFKSAALIDDNVKKRIKDLFLLAPLHNPMNFLGIQLMEKRFPNLQQVAVFDTSFHHTLPARAFTYAIPRSWQVDLRVRRYGFHGISHKYVVSRAGEILDNKDLRVVSAHLGNGCSLAAVRGKQSLDTSMGFTPLEGLVMGQRSGDLDPSIITYVGQRLNCSPSEIIHILNHESGLLGLSGTPDSSLVEERAESGCLTAKLAIELFCYRASKYIASYVVPLGGLDALMFTGGIGENSHIKRKKILEFLQPLNFSCDDISNREANSKSETIISRPKSEPYALVIPTNEELVIAEETAQLVDSTRT